MKAKLPGPTEAKLTPGQIRYRPDLPRFITEVPRERRQFREFILTNPNYFGTLPGSALTPVMAISQNSSYEEINCIGYNPQSEELSAVVVLKQSAGYLSGLCSAGSPEYVRFYLWDAAASEWRDQGVTSFIAHDMPHTDILSYSVTLKIDPAQKMCSQPNLLKVRAILSWNEMPEPNTPAYVPVWGQVREATIQVKALPPLHAGPLDEPLLDSILPGVKFGAIGALPISNWKEMLQKKALAPRATTALKASLLTNPKLAKPVIKKLTAILPELPVMLAAPPEAETNEQYEALTCVGYNPNLSTLVATLVVKQSQGYLQTLCHPGSREHVAFWVDWSDGAGWTYAGTSSVEVHDIPGVPDGGLHYAVSLPVNTATHTAPCSEGPQIYRVRAVLSWESLPSQTDPNWLPYWGSVVDAQLQVKPGPVVPVEEHLPLIETVGGMAVSSISADGLADGPGVMAGFVAEDSPFGGLVVLTGHIANPPAVSEPPLKYRIMVSDDLGLTWHPLNNKFPIWISQFTGTDWSGPTQTTQAPDELGWYTYRAAEPTRFVAGNVLAYWYTAPHEGKWQLRMDVMEPDSSVITGAQVVTLLLDNRAPEVSLKLDTPEGNCNSFAPNAEIWATYTVSDEHLAYITAHIDPHDKALMATITFAADTAYPFVTTTAGAKVKVTNLDVPCGYVLRVEAVDRTIVNSGSVGFRNHDAVGFCVRQAQS